MIEDEYGITDNYIRARQYDPNDFDKESFRTIRLASGVKAIVGKMAGDNSLVAQSIIFKKDRFDQIAATNWLKRNMERISEAIELENKKIGLFDMDVSFEQHLEGHLPPLTEQQIQRLLELAGSPDIPEDGEDVEDDEDEDYAHHLSKYFKRL